MIAILFNNAGVRLGEVSVSDATLAIHFGGSFFGRTEVEALTDDCDIGISFQESTVLHLTKLDRYDPRKMAMPAPASTERLVPRRA